jgi:hypothetical protein
MHVVGTADDHRVERFTIQHFPKIPISLCMAAEAMRLVEIPQVHVTQGRCFVDRYIGQIVVASVAYPNRSDAQTLQR